MIIECINCGKKFDVNSDLIPNNGRTIQCGSCNHIWFYNPNKENTLIEKNKKKIPSHKPIIEKKEDEIKLKEKIHGSIKTEKKFEVTKYQSKSNINLSKFLSYIFVTIISFVALIILIDTFKTILYTMFPGLELILFSLFETLKDIKLFIKDLI